MRPLFELKINANVTDDLQVDYVAGVDKPAIERNFLAFQQQEPLAEITATTNFAEVKDEERIVFGAAMIPNLKIYRKDKQGNEFDVFFSEQTIKNIAVKFFEKGYQNNFNLMHDPTQQKDGVVFFQSLIKDDTKGIQGMQGDYPNGTWFLGAKVNNDEVWAKVKSGEIKGFSVEGLFNYKQVPSEAQMIEQLKDVFNENLSEVDTLQKIIYIINGTI